MAKSRTILPSVARLSHLKPVLALGAAIAIGCLSPIASAVPSSENAALRYWRVWSFMHAGTIRDDFYLVSVYDGAYDPEFNHADEGHEVVTSEDLLGSLEGFIDGLIEATEFPACDFGIDYDKGVDALLPHLPPIRKSAQLLILDAKRLLAEGDTDGATERIAACFRLSQHITGDTTLINSLVSLAVFGLAEDLVLENQASFSDANRQSIAEALARFQADDPFGCVKSVLGEAEHFGDWMMRRVDDEWSTLDRFAADFTALFDGDPQDEIMSDFFSDTVKTPEDFRRLLRSEIDQYCTALHLMAEAWNSPDAEKSLNALEAKIIDGSFGTVTKVMAPALTRCHHNDMRGREKLSRLREWASVR